nr:MAG TPA: hypothetical protein [Caudoviricetes sp.]
MQYVPLGGAVPQRADLRQLHPSGRGIDRDHTGQ